MLRHQLLFILACVLAPLGLQAQNTTEVRVVLTDGPGRDIVQRLANHASQVMTALGRFDPAVGTINLPAAISAGEGVYGVRELTELAKGDGIKPSATEYHSQVVLSSNNTYEIRRMYVTTNEATGSKPLELVLSFNQAGQLTNARYALVEHQYDTIIREAISIEDDFRRRQIIAYLEQFRTAYNRKDVNYIELQFSEQALIITGTRVSAGEAGVGVVKPRDNETYIEQYRFTRHSKGEYIDRLKNTIFKVNDFINVDFSAINILQHDRYEDVYWVSVYQKWSSSTYSDEGYLAFMIDFSNEDQPLIYVRTWQPEPFDDGSLIDMNMFEIIK